MNDHSTEDKLALQKRGEQTNAGAAKYSESIGIGLAWAKGTLPVGTYKDLAKRVYATLTSNDPNRYEQAARVLSEMMDESARQQKAFQDATKGSKVWVGGGDPEKAAEYARQLRAANAVKAQAEAEAKAKAEAAAKAKADVDVKLSGNTAGGTQGVQGAQAGAQAGNEVARGGVQGSNNGSGKKPRMSDAEINAFLKEELGVDTADGAQGAQADNGTYASSGVAKGGTKTVGYDPYDPNPGNVSLAYAMRNAPEQERRAALINEWNKEHGRTGSTGYATGKGMLTSSSNGSYSSQEGIETPMPASDNWKFRAAWKDPMAIIGQFGKEAFTDNEYNQLVNHAVNDLGFNEELFSRGRYK